jgi:two-component system, OmpR family, sensor histidine kinase CpxA
MNWSRCNPVNYLAGRIFLWFWLVLSVAVACAILLARGWPEQTEIRRLPHPVAEQFRHLTEHFQPFANLTTLQRDLERKYKGRWLMVDVDNNQLLNPDALPVNFDPNWLTELSQLSRPRMLVHKNTFVMGPLLIMASDKSIALFQLKQRPEQAWWQLHALPEGSLLLLLLAVSAIASLILALSITRPLRELSSSHLRFAQGELDNRVSALAARKDELGDLGRGFNTMAAQIENLIHNQQRLLRDVSHELRSPLTRSQLALALQQRQSDTPQLQRIEMELKLLDQLLDELLTFSRLDAGQYPLEKQQLDLTELLNAIIELNQLEADAKFQQISIQAPEQCWLLADQRLLGRAIENVLRNAIKYSPPQSLIQCRLVQKEQQLELTIADQGPGVPADSLEQIFAPFYRVSSVREHQNGTGLGLAIAAQAIRQHQGSISASLPQQGGLLIRILLPLTS